MLFLVLTPIPKIFSYALGGEVHGRRRTRKYGRSDFQNQNKGAKGKSEIKERDDERGKYIFPPLNLRFGDRDSAERFFVERGIPSLVLNEFNLI